MIDVDGRTKAGKWTLLILPLITVLREGIEAIVFVGGVSLGQPATSIPLAAIIGIICGLIVGYLIYAFASRTSQFLLPLSTADAHRQFISTALTIFLIVMTNLILLIGSGLFSRSIGNFQEYKFNKLSVCLVRIPHSVLWTLTITSSCFLGWALTLTMPVVTGRGRTTSVETFGTSPAAIPRTEPTIKDG